MGQETTREGQELSLCYSRKGFYNRNVRALANLKVDFALGVLPVDLALLCSEPYCLSCPNCHGLKGREVSLAVVILYAHMLIGYLGTGLSRRAGNIWKKEYSLYLNLRCAKLQLDQS